MSEYIKREDTLQIIDYAKQLTNEQIVKESGTYELLSDTGKACYDGIVTALDMCKRLVNEAVVAAEVKPKTTCRMIPLEPDCRRYTDVFICTHCHQHIHLGFIRKEYSGNFCLECGAEVKED